MRTKNKYGSANLAKMPTEVKELKFSRDLIPSRAFCKEHELETDGLFSSILQDHCWLEDNTGSILQCASLTYGYLVWHKLLTEFIFVGTFTTKVTYELVALSTPKTTFMIVTDI